MKALWLILNSGVLASFYCDSTLNQRCPDGSLCTSATADCQTLGPRQCICGGNGATGGEWCDSVDGNQRCSDGTPCSAQFLECSNPRHCRCGSKNSGALITGEEFCDSTLGNQRCKDGTPCDAQHLTCATPQKCACGSRRAAMQIGGQTEFCNPSENQRCMDGTPCNTQSLDCPTPQTCICGSRVRELGVSEVTQQGLEFCDSTVPNQKCKDGTLCSKQLIDCDPDPHRCLCGSSPMRQLDHADHTAHGGGQARSLRDRELCDSTVGNQVCQDGTPCTAQNLDCTNPKACICGSSPSQAGSLVGGELCDPTANQRCKDGSFCLAQILDCISPQSCRCGSRKNSQSGSGGGEFCDSTTSQRCQDGSVCSAQLLECTTPQSCRCGSRRNNDLNQMLPHMGGMIMEEFCDPTLNQRCADGSLCSQEVLNCIDSKSCRCGTVKTDIGSLSRNLQGTTSSLMGSQVERCDSTIHQRCRDGTLCSTETMECSSPKSCICGSRKQEGAQQSSNDRESFQARQAELDRQFNMQRQLHNAQKPIQGAPGTGSGQGVEYCDSTLGDKCRDGTPCSSQFIDCSNPLSCICGSSPSGGPPRDITVQKGRQDSFNQVQDDGSRQGVSNGQWSDWVEARRMQARNSDGGIKPKVEYCDSTLQQKCKDGTVCSPQYLDCTTKGLKRCICGSSLIGGDFASRNVGAGNFDGGDFNVNSHALTTGNFNVGGIPGASFRVGNFDDQQQRSLQQSVSRYIAGVYCLDNDLYYCDQLQQCTPQTRCLNGCISAPLGQPDYCIPENNQHLQGQSLNLLSAPDFRPQTQNRGALLQDTTKRVKYCDSLANPPQKCGGRTPCSPQYLDCATKGPTKCICEGGVDSSGNFIAGPAGSSSGSPIGLVETQIGGSSRNLVGSSLGATGSLGISASIGSSLGSGLPNMPSFSGAVIQDSSQNGWFGAGLYCMGNNLHYCSATQQCNMAEQCSNGCFSAPSSLPDYCIPGQDLTAVSKPQRKASPSSIVKTGVKYCDSLANPPERCQDATPCLPQYLDCTTKGPRRCICEGGDSSFARSVTNVLPDIFQRRSDGNLDHVGDDWNGPGLYCNEQTSDLVYCNANFECRLAEHCQKGCLNAPGVMGYCIKGTNYLGAGGF